MVLLTFTEMNTCCYLQVGFKGIDFTTRHIFVHWASANGSNVDPIFINQPVYENWGGGVWPLQKWFRVDLIRGKHCWEPKGLPKVNAVFTPPPPKKKKHISFRQCEQHHMFKRRLRVQANAVFHPPQFLYLYIYICIKNTNETEHPSFAAMAQGQVHREQGLRLVAGFSGVPGQIAAGHAVARQHDPRKTAESNRNAG